MDAQTQAPKKWTPDAIAGVSLLVMALIGVVFVIYIGNQETTDVRVYFDNGLDQTITAAYDDTVVATATAHSAIEKWLPVGTHTVKIIGEKGEIIEETQVIFPPAKGTVARQWVYNVSTANEYIMRFIPYGNATPEEPQILGAGERYFELPNNSPVFACEGGIPTKGRANTNMALISHLNMHVGSKCCESIVEFINKMQKKD